MSQVCLGAYDLQVHFAIQFRNGDNLILFDDCSEYESFSLDPIGLIV